MTRPHIAYVCADRGIPLLGTKGGSTHIRELVNAMARRGAEICVLTARRSDGACAARVGARIIEVGGERFPRALRDRIRAIAPGAPGEAIGSETLGLLLNQELYLRLQRLHARRGIDVVYERYSLWGYAGLTFARDHAIPFVLEVNAPLRIEQERYRALRNGVLAEALEGQLFQLADRVVVPSSVLRDYVVSRGARAGRVRLVPNAADPAAFRLPDDLSPRDRDGTFVVGFLGSLKPWHGVQDLLRAFVLLYRRSPSCRLLIVGDGPLRPAVEQVCRSERLAGVVQLTGEVDYARVPGLLARMDVAVAPYPRLSNFYFSPLKMYEYMAAGVPIVASAIGQITEVLSHRKTALLHPPGSVSKMVAHIEELRDRPRLRARLAREARRLAVKRFTWDRNAARVLSMVATLRRQVREGRYAPQEEPVL
jgi:glycosyltransferase involved in cell wall biosynthesis